MKRVVRYMLLAIMILGVTAVVPVFAGDKFEDEVEKEQGAVKLAREVQKGGYDLITAEELKKMMDDGKDVLIVGVLPVSVLNSAG